MLRLCKYYHNGSGRQDEWMLIMDGNGAGGGRRIGFVRRTRNRNMAYGEHGTAVMGPNGILSLTNFRCCANATIIPQLDFLQDRYGGVYHQVATQQRSILFVSTINLVTGEIEFSDTVRSFSRDQLMTITELIIDQVLPWIQRLYPHVRFFFETGDNNWLYIVG